MLRSNSSALLPLTTRYGLPFGYLSAIISCLKQELGLFRTNEKTGTMSASMCSNSSQLDSKGNNARRLCKNGVVNRFEVAKVNPMRLVSLIIVFVLLICMGCKKAENAAK